ncbi:hypothetical protein [Parasphingorhabdus sp.]
MLIVVAAIWSAASCTPRRLWLAAIGSIIFGLAAAIGVYRFGTGQIAELGGFHKDFSQTGGAIAMALMSAQLLFASTLVKRFSYGPIIVGGLIIATIIVALLVSWSATWLFIGWLSLAILAAAFITDKAFVRRLYLTAIVSIFLINLLLVRRSPDLGPDLSWHLFHGLIAIWLIGMIYVYKDSAAQNMTS